MGSKIKNLDLTQPARQARPPAYSGVDDGFRRISGAQQDDRELLHISQERMIRLAYFLYDTTGMTKRFVGDTKDFVIGGGVTFSVENDPSGAAHDVLTAFWSDPYNNMDLLMEDRLKMLFLLGELCLATSVEPNTGAVRLGYIDPENIASVKTVEGFPEIPDSVKLVDGTSSGRRLACVRYDPQNDRMVGECFFWGINKPPNASRGRSDLIHLFDFIEGYESGLFDELDRLKMIKSFIWDVEIDGATGDEIEEFLRKNPAPKPGSIRAHSEDIKWQAVAPDLKNADTKAFFDTMRSFIAAGMNRPDSWFGSGGKAYQTEADLMGEPVFNGLEARQRRVKYMYSSILRYVLDMAIQYGTIPRGDYVISVDMPPVTPKNYGRIAEVMGKLSQSLVVAENQGWISTETAARVFGNTANQLGVDIDVDAELEKIDDDPNVTTDYENE